MMSYQKHVHLIGIGGISMSGIAKILLKNNIIVSGSDIKNNHLIEELREKGAKVYIGHSKENIKNPDLVIISSAIPKNNPELKMAQKKNIKVLKRAEYIAELMKEKKSIAISGTHGKTTTTGMISTIFKKADLAPTILLGGELNEIGGNVFKGSGDYLITEADESDGSLLYFDPLISVITNIEFDHLDYYNSKNKLINTFKKFIEKSRGTSVVCIEDKNIKNIVNNIDDDFISYGINNGDLQGYNIQILPFGSLFEVKNKEKILGEINLQIPGKYNILNALAATAVGLYCGLDFREIKKGLESFSGVKRRFEKKGLINNILIIDDYAHHPTEIKETLNAAQNTGYERIIAVFQPHRYSRTKNLFSDFVNSFKNVDHLIILDIYSAGEKPENEDDKKRARDLAREISKKYDFNVDFIKSLEDVTSYLQEIMIPKDLILTIGAGDVYKIGENLIKILNEKREMA